MSNYSTFTDQNLIELLRKGDRAAFTEVYNRHWQAAYHSAYHILKDEDVCSDVIQDVFVWLWQHHEKLEIRSLKAYIITAVKFKMLNAIRQSRLKVFAYEDVQVELVDPMSIEEDLEVKELQKIIDEFTDELPEQAKRIFYLSRKENFSNKEIGLQMGISEKTVKNQMNISLKKLRTKLGKRSFLATLF